MEQNPFINRPRLDLRALVIGAAALIILALTSCMPVKKQTGYRGCYTGNVKLN